jgi:RHS repeat-associated protein
MMDALQRLQAFGATRHAGRELHCEQGLPVALHDGAALCRYTWAAGELASIVEPDGTRYDYLCGDDGRLLAVQRNGQPWASYGYDAQGHLAEAERADGSRAYDRDEQGRLLRTRRGAAAPWVYRWRDGRVAEAMSAQERSSFGYDTAGRLTGLVQHVAGVALGLRFEFDAAGRLSGIVFPDWQQQIGFKWDERGRAASLSWNGQPLFQFGSDDATRSAWSEGPDGLRATTLHERASGRPVAQHIRRGGHTLWQSVLERDEAFRLVREGERRHRYDLQGRLVESLDASRQWHWRYDAADQPLAEGEDRQIDTDAVGRVRAVRSAAGERVFRYDDGGELESLLVNGECVARCVYDHKGRLVLKQGRCGVERYLYGADDGLLAVADEQGLPRLIVLRLPTGVVGLIDFRRQAAGEPLALHADAGGNLVFVGDAQGAVSGPLACDPFGLPLQPEGRVPAIFRGRFWHAEMGLYRIGGRWYDPALRRFLTPDSHTGAPDDARLVSPFVNASEQRLLRARMLADWLREPRQRCRFAYCLNDPVNRFDPDGHWSFGGVLLSLLGVLWTLPNTAFGLAIEVSCLIGEVVRWLVYAFTLGHVSWQTPGFDVAASGRLNAFALVFKGGWLGSFESLLGITFGNVIFVNGQYEQHPAFQALPDPVSPPAYNGTVTIPKAQALYEHELRHVNQYGWFGPFFHLGLPLFGVYEWDVILNGYEDASLEKDARDHGGF